MTDQLPAPLVPAETNIGDFPYMPLEVRRVRNSDLAAEEKPEACWAAVLLWCACWEEVPAASLPDTDAVLAKAAGYGRDVRGWLKVRAGALRGWVKCSDGRLYHPLVAEKALEAWLEKLAQRISGGEGNAKRWGVPFDRRELDEQMAEARTHLACLNPMSRMLSRKRTAGIPTTSLPDSHPDSGNDRKRERKREREGGGGSAPEARIPTPPPASPTADPIPGSHLVESLDALGLPSHHPEALAQWVALLTGPLVRASTADEQREALTWMVRKALAAGNGERVQFAKHAQPFAGLWREHLAARNRPPEPAKPPEKSAAELEDERRTRRLAGRLQDWERDAIARGTFHVGPAGEWRKGPTPADPPPAGQEPAA